MSNRKSALMKTAVALIGFTASVIGSSAWAGTATANMNVTASVTQTCTVATPPDLAFGPYDPIVANATAPLTATSTISVKCTKASSGITVNIGVGNNAASTQRQMKGATSADLLQYNILQPTAGSPYSSCTATAWGTAAGGSLYTPTGVTWGTTAATFTVCGSIPAAQNVSIDNYSDIVQVAVNF